MLTVDITNPEMAQRLSEHDWIIFWNQIAGWQANHDSSKINDQIMTRAEYDEKRAQAELKKLDPPVYLPPAEVHIGDDIPRLVDVTETTRLDLLVAVLFLGVYWLAAGPIGHLVLRAYKVVHWSWWIFGATVVVAAAVASAIVMFLQLTNYDLRHKTIVLGTVNTRDVTVVGYYGVYAPVSGGITVSQPASGGGGLNYLAPMCMPTNESVKPFADPQSYQLRNENPHEAAPIFRNTLKKMQGRWSGVHEGIEGSATFVGGPESHFAGSLVNHSGYTLEHVEFLIHGPPTGKAQDQGISYLYAAAGGGSWKNGETLDLAKGLQIEHYHDSSLPMRLEDVLQSLGRHFSQGGSIASSLTHGVAVVPPVHEDASLLEGRSDDLLYLLLDLRKPDPLADAERVEPTRPFARTTDCTKAFYAAGAMIIARAGNISSEHYVASPVPLTVNGRLVPGKGDILFAWALPIAGNVGAVPAMPDLNQLPANPKISAPIDPAQEPQ